MDQSSDDGRPKKGRSAKSSGPAFAGFDELRDCQATRTHLADMCRAPFFDEWVQSELASLSSGHTALLESGSDERCISFLPGRCLGSLPDAR